MKTIYLLIISICMLCFACSKDDDSTSNNPNPIDSIEYNDVYEFEVNLIAGGPSHYSPNSNFYYFEVTADSSDISVEIETIFNQNTPSNISMDIELATVTQDTMIDIQQEFNITQTTLLQSNAPKGLYTVKVFGNLPGIQHNYKLKVSGNGLNYNGERKTETIKFEGKWSPWGTGTYYLLGNYEALRLAAKDPYFEISPKENPYFFEIKVETDEGSDFIYRQEQVSSPLLIEHKTVEATNSYLYFRPLNNKFNYDETLNMQFVGQKVNPAGNYTISFTYWIDDPIEVIAHNLIEHKIEDAWYVGGGNNPNNLTNPNYKFEATINEPVWLDMIIVSEIEDFNINNPEYNFILYNGVDSLSRNMIYNLQEYNNYIEYSPLNINNLVGEIYRIPIYESGEYSIAFLGDSTFVNQNFEFYLISQGKSYNITEPEKMW